MNKSLFPFLFLNETEDCHRLWGISHLFRDALLIKYLGKFERERRHSLQLLFCSKKLKEKRKNTSDYRWQIRSGENARRLSAIAEAFRRPTYTTGGHERWCWPASRTLLCLSNGCCNGLWVQNFAPMSLVLALFKMAIAINEMAGGLSTQSTKCLAVIMLIYEKASAVNLSTWHSAASTSSLHRPVHRKRGRWNTLFFSPFSGMSCCEILSMFADWIFIIQNP